jgi:NitT/TauT family transport system ATP-binding protein
MEAALSNAAGSAQQGATGAAHVTLRGVCKSFNSKRGDVRALANVDLDIRAGEFLSLLGPSGCGKSTLLRCLAGLDQITSGEVRMHDRLMDGPPDDMGIVFQRDMLLDWRTVLDNVFLPLEFRRKPTKPYAEAALNLLETFGLRRSANRYPWELSGGMRQRAAICRALLDDPALLLMDEPFGALDAMTRDRMNLELQQIHALSGATVVFVTHSISEAVFLADRVVLLTPRPGRIRSITPVDLPRPRAAEVEATAGFGELVVALRRELDQED